MEIDDVFANGGALVLKVHINNIRWNEWKVTTTFHTQKTDEPVDLFHLSTEPTGWKAGLEVGLRQG